MISVTYRTAVVLLCLCCCAPAQSTEDTSWASGDYFGQTPPGSTPELFAPGLISTSLNEVNAVFTPDHTEFYFSRFEAGHGYTIMVSRRSGNSWSTPVVAPFSGEYSEVDPCLTPDGKTMLFISKRPHRADHKRSSGYQIWSMDREDDDWGEPRHMGQQVNPGDRQLYPTISRDGTVYFSSDVGGYGKMDFFCSRPVDGQYQPPANLGETINTEFDETDLLVAPDESYVIFTSVDRPDGFGSGDLYISFRRDDQSWGRAVNMGGLINTSSSEFCPMLSPGGKHFFFTSRRAGSDDIYWVDALIIDNYRTPGND
jgi:hypothetical protein